MVCAFTGLRQPYVSAAALDGFASVSLHDVVKVVGDEVDGLRRAILKQHGQQIVHEQRDAVPFQVLRCRLLGR